MLKISRRTGLGLLLMTELARLEKDQYLGLKSWAKKKKLPYRFLSKIAVVLKKAGLLNSKEGRKGGYYLAQPAATIKVKAVIEGLEGPVAAAPCLRGEKCVAEKFCGQKQLMIKLTKVVNNQLIKVTIMDLC